MYKVSMSHDLEVTLPSFWIYSYKVHQNCYWIVSLNTKIPYHLMVVKKLEESQISQSHKKIQDDWRSFYPLVLRACPPARLIWNAMYMRMLIVYPCAMHPSTISKLLSLLCTIPKSPPNGQINIVEDHKASFFQTVGTLGPPSIWRVIIVHISHKLTYQVY